MFHLRQVLSAQFLQELAESTAQGIARRDCFFNQFHYVNRRFVAKHFEQLAGLVVDAVREVHPGITTRDLTYVNDFVAPINLANAQIHSHLRNNKYVWHTDVIDRVFQPCYNLWIPFYRRSALSGLDDQSVFDVLTPASCPRFYDADGNYKYDNFPWSPDVLPPHDRELLARLVDVPAARLDHYVIFHDGQRTEKVAAAELTPVSVVRPKLGDCHVFSSKCLHASGPSRFERIGISIKFLVNNPQLGFRVLPHSSSPLAPGGWWGMFVSWYERYGTFSAYKDVLHMYLERERPQLEMNADKLECVRSILLQIAHELGAQDRGDPGDTVMNVGSAQE